MQEIRRLMAEQIAVEIESEGAGLINVIIYGFDNHFIRVRSVDDDSGTVQVRRANVIVKQCRFIWDSAESRSSAIQTAKAWIDQQGAA